MNKKRAHTEEFMTSVALPQLMFGNKTKVQRNAKLHVQNVFNITPRMLSKFMNKFYQPDRTVIVISGKFRRNQLLPILKNKLQNIPNNHYPLNRVVTKRISRQAKVLCINNNREVCTCILSFYAFTSNQYREKYACYFLSRILSGIGSKSILFQRLRVKLGMTYSPNISTTVNKYYATFNISFDTKKKHLQTILSEIVNILIELKNNLLDKEYLSLALDNYNLGVKKAYVNIIPATFIQYGDKILDNDQIFTPKEIFNNFHKKITATYIRSISRKIFKKEFANLVILGKDVSFTQQLSQILNKI